MNTIKIVSLTGCDLVAEITTTYVTFYKHSTFTGNTIAFFLLDNTRNRLRRISILPECDAVQYQYIRNFLHQNNYYRL